MRILFGRVAWCTVRHGKAFLAAFSVLPNSLPFLRLYPSSQAGARTCKTLGQCIHFWERFPALPNSLPPLSISPSSQAGARICKTLGQDFLPYMPLVMPPLLAAAQLKPDVVVR